ncbi:MAG TPA: membrane-bound lytic murein transglycosylase MltF [Gammaproteobacteria bacterium]|nr:membrane-bound lytic murein transglycosylase MltF [Gammaproteobacteria bacterium]
MSRLRTAASKIRAALRLATSLPARLMGAAVLALLLATCAQRPSLLAQIKQLGVLRVVTRNSPTTFYFGPHGPTGFEYDLARLFADSLGVRLEIYAPLSLTDVLTAVGKGHADVGAAGLSVTAAREQHLRFGPPYQYVTQKVIYRNGEAEPNSPADLIGHRLTVLADSSHAARLADLKRQYPALAWTATDAAESQELLAQVAHGDLDYAIADSNEFALDRRYYPELRAAFDLNKPEPLAWAFRRNGDLSLYQAAIAFFARIRADGKLTQITNRYYGASEVFDYVGTRTFIHDVKTMLPRYQPWFEAAAEKTSVEWQLLAAIGYQESHWNPHAVSPTGVRGVMMLTLDTAGDLGVDNRINPKQSIIGGAQYFARMESRIPAEVSEPDRTWMALAAYNIGLGHIMDAREITRERGGNPNRWIDVRASLPLLTEKKWYSQTKYGYARGDEPLIYVANIRSYYSILNWITSRPKEPVPEAPTTASNEDVAAKQ